MARTSPLVNSERETDLLTIISVAEISGESADKNKRAAITYSLSVFLLLSFCNSNSPIYKITKYLVIGYIGYDYRQHNYACL